MADVFPVPFGSHRSYRDGKRRSMLLALAACGGMLTTPALAQNGAKRDSIGKDAVDAVTQPLSDLNLRGKDIPSVLLVAQASPYSLDRGTDCASLYREVGRLDEVLGPDADEEADSEGLINKGLKVGGNILGGLIPFRGLVRQLSGANAERARWQAAIYSGIARRSFLKGFAKARLCTPPQEAAVRSAEQVLGLEPPSEPEAK